jgi:predicted dehydrogenase
MMRGYDRVFAIHENHRYRPWFSRLARQAREGLFGRISFARFEHLNGSGPPPGFKTESPAGVLLEYGSHLVDMMRAVLGDPERVYARFARVNPDVGGESLAHLVYEYGDSTAVVSAAWKNTGTTQGSVLIHGAKREAVYDGTLTRGGVARVRVSEAGVLIEDEARSPYDDYAESFYLLQREVTDAMLGRGAVVQTAEEHMRTVVCTFAGYESARRGEPVALAEFEPGWNPPPRQ